MSALSLPAIPKCLFISLRPPVGVYLSTMDWELGGQVRIRGLPVDGNDTPWCSFADLLIDEEDRRLVGLTFKTDEQEYWGPMQKIAQRLDSKVVHYNDLSTASAQQRYPGEAG
jgi:hypothetical protein